MIATLSWVPLVVSACTSKIAQTYKFENCTHVPKLVLLYLPGSITVPSIYSRVLSMHAKAATLASCQDGRNVLLVRHKPSSLQPRQPSKYMVD